MSTHPQQQQSSPKEGSKENTILNGQRHQKERSAQGHPSCQADSMPQEPATTAPTCTSQTGGPPQAPPVNNQNRNQTEVAHCNNNKVPFSHLDGRGQHQPSGGQHRPQPPEINSQILIQIFLLGDTNMPTLMKVSTGDILLPYFLPLDSITQWPVTLLVDPSSS